MDPDAGGSSTPRDGYGAPVAGLAHRQSDAPPTGALGRGSRGDDRPTGSAQLIFREGRATTAWTGVTKPIETIHALTGLRFVAAAAVVAYHVQYIPGARLPGLLGTMVAQGRAGVSLFFVLSGFVLAYRYGEGFRSGLRDYRAYLQARFARIGPLYVIALLLMTPVSLVALPVLSPGRAISSSGLAASWLANLLAVQSWLPMPVLHVWDDPQWSVSDEAFFYLVFPLFFYGVLARPRRLRGLVALSGLLYVAEVASFVIAVGLATALAVAQRRTDGPLLLLEAINWPPARIWEFLLGCVAGVAFLQQSRPSTTDSGRREALLGATVVTVLAVAALPDRPDGLWPLANLVRYHVAFTPLFVVLIYGLARGRTLLSTALESRTMVRLGDASYALYLIHWIPVTILRQAALDGHPVPAPFVVGCVLLTIPASLALYSWVEVPARRALRPKRGD